MIGNQTMHKGMKKQQGMTLISWVFVALIAAIIAIVVIRLVPAYMESFSVKSSLDSLTEEKNIKTMSSDKIKDLFAKRLLINEVRHVKADELKVKKTDTGMQLIMNYEIRVHTLSNIDAVMMFNEEVTIE